jgi:regulatory protein
MAPPRARKPPRPRKPPPEPTEAVLHEAALTYVARFGATQAGVVRVLDRKIGRRRRRMPASAWPKRARPRGPWWRR